MIDRRPRYYQIVLLQEDATVIFLTENMESPRAVDDLRAWALRVHERLVNDPP